MDQITLHKKIDAFIKNGPTGASVEIAKTLIQANFDARLYFYTKANELWLAWLWENELLNALKEKSETPDRISYRFPELNYMERIAEKEPAKMVDIMLAIPLSEEQPNPEVLDRFSRICSKLPATDLVKIVPKIHKENWVRLLSKFDHFGFEYERMLKTLSDIKDYKNVLLLAEIILTVRPKTEGKTGVMKMWSSSDNPFYLEDLNYTKVFEYLVDISIVGAFKFKEEALSVATQAMKNVVLTGNETEEGDIFKINDTFHLYDVDFFDLQLNEIKHISYRDDVRSLSATVKRLAIQTISVSCDKPDVSKDLYEKYFQTLPDSRAMWRLRLFTLSLCPLVFKSELKNSFFKLFNDESYTDLLSGTEYYKTLRVCFSTLSEEDKRRYISEVFRYFSKHIEQDKGDQRWHKTYGWRILSSINDYLTSNESDECEKVFGRKSDGEFEPEPSIMKSRGGTINPQSPITQEEFGKLSIDTIAKNLRTIWTPKALKDQKGSDDFLNPINAEGVGARLRADIPKRMQDYLDNSNLFFERDVLDPHYTYSFLNGFHEVFRKKEIDFSIMKLEGLLNMLMGIVNSGKNKAFDTEMRDRGFDGWLSGWTAIHSSMSDVLQSLLNEQGNPLIDFNNNRASILVIIRYLLNYPDPTPKDETEESGDPFSKAINTTRGRTFQTFTVFVHQDVKKLPKDVEMKLLPDVKEVYDEILKKEDTQALMFMFGHYLPSFYYRDIDWMKEQFKFIFPKEEEKQNLYLGALEGYLVANLYKELFVELKDEYMRAIAFDPSKYPKRKYYRDLDEALATHIGLAYVHFSDFGLTDDLFKVFWEKKDTKKHKSFVSFVGRHCISRERADLWLQELKVDKEKIKSLWDWILDHCDDTEALAEFGFWMNARDGAFNNDIPWLATRMVKTLEKTKGDIKWEIKLMDSLPLLVDTVPEDTLKILRLYFTGPTFKQRPGYFRTDVGTVELFKKLYKNPSKKMQGEVYDLINELLPLNNGLFWALKDVIE